MLLNRTNRILLAANLCRVNNKNVLIRTNLREFVSKSRPGNNRISKLLAYLGLGFGSFYLYEKYRQNSSTSKIDTQFGHTEEATLNLDLNEIYEKTAVVFLSNPEVGGFYVLYF